MKIIFMGTPDFAVPVLDALVEEGYDIAMVVTQPDRPKGRKQVLTKPPVKTAAEKHGLKVYQPEKIKKSEEAKPVVDEQADLLVTAAYGQILPPEILTSPKHGCINVHASLLPEYRGGAPIHYAVMDGKEITGITIMYMADQLDAGEILTQCSVPIDETDTTGTMHDKLSKAGAELLIDTIPKLMNHELTPVKQDENLVTFAPNIKKEQERIDFSKPAKSILNQIRGLNPWPVAHTMLRGERLKIWEAESAHQSSSLKPGTITEIANNGLEVVCGDGKVIRLTKLQPSGKKPQDSAAFLQGAGRQLRKGERLGENDE
ncbi:methionyl-tRNA formyltransferase [Salisediminibacterium beveridgei]|uniref:Methionyl-tRNA formyltransferase n=1 Tax=Salisediminibacterium beveridgei TaxID=632773 RepID=A0A1D7QW90_9BACI|nr:methionyl-tRNA formyltransferase [Salisediminibacterium beveridgei]AOM83239.1 Methionyl-tRNA formyltransferase [Salisediminibacterium beveridgei]